MAQANSPPRRQGGGNGKHSGGAPSGRDDEESHYLNNGLVLRVTSGDITQVSAEAVVAGEDSHFSGDGGVATALCRAGGKKYTQERQKMISKVNSLKIKGPVYYSSPGGGLKFKYVFHAVTVNRSHHEVSEKNDLKEVYQHLGKVAEDQRVRTIVTPLLGTGHEGRPMEESLQAVVDGLSRMKPLKFLQEVTIVEFKEEKVSEIRDKLRDILEAAAKGDQGPRQAGRGDWKNQNSAAGSSAGSHGGKPQRGFHRGAMHGGSDSGTNSAPQASQASACKRSASQDTLQKETTSKMYPTGIVEKQREKYEAASQNPTTSRGSGTAPTRTYAEAAATNNSGQSRGAGANRNLNSGPIGKPGDFGRARDRGRGRRGEDPHRRDRDSYEHTSPSASATPSAGKGEPKKPDTTPENAETTSTINIVRMDEEEDSGDEEGTDDDQGERFDAGTGNKRSQSVWSAEKYSSDDEGECRENSEPPRSDHPPHRRQREQTWSSSSLPDSQSQPSCPHTDQAMQSHQPGAPVSRRYGGDDDDHDDNDNNDSESPNPPRRSNHNNRHSNDDEDDNDDVDDDDEEEDDYGNDNSAGVYENNSKSHSEARSRQEAHPKEDDNANESPSVGFDDWSQRPEEEDTSGTVEVQPQESHNLDGVGSAEGKMVVTKKSDLSLMGFPDCGTILIEYSFPNGTQEPQHPAPGQPYKGTFRRAFLPDNQEGRRVVELLKEAFDSKLTFRVVPTDQGWGVEFADIPHKTSLRGGQKSNGYPDQDYLSRVTSTLARLGVK